MERRRPKPWKDYGRYGSVGLELLLSMAIGYYGGRWLDRHLHTNGWLAAIGFFVGVYAGFRAIFQTAGKMTKDIERAEKAERGEDPWATDEKKKAEPDEQQAKRDDARP